MRQRELSDLAAYEREVKSSPKEVQELVEEVVVAESWFFRDERPFEWLRGYVRQRLESARARLPLRILSVPCAAGEEPYSIAIVLAEEGFPVGRYRIDAIDTSARRLAIARRGVYSKNAFRGPVLPYRSRWFRDHPEGYEIDPALRASIDFTQGSILDPQLLKDSQPYDLVFCRNLLIYLIPSARETLLGLVNRVLAPDGVLLIGHADRVESTGAGKIFAPTDDAGCFTYRWITRGKAAAAAGQVPLESPASIPNSILVNPIHASQPASPPETTGVGARPQLRQVPITSFGKWTNRHFY